MVVVEEEVGGCHPDQVRELSKTLSISIYKKIFSFQGGSSCNTDRCNKITIAVICTVAGIAVIGCVIYVCYRTNSSTGTPAVNNGAFVQNISSNQTLDMKNKSLFQSGTWKSQYCQYGKWHGPHQLSLTFTTNNTQVKGTGCDDVGSFNISGTYSTKTQRLAFEKKYQAGTGNRAENLGHKVIIQLEWNSHTNQFEGKWYVRTAKYSGQDKFTLKRSPQQYSNPNLIV